MVPPDDKELELIEQLRKNVQDLDLCEEVLGNANLIRWIRARNGNVSEAEEMFRNYVKWYDEAELESIFEENIPEEVFNTVRLPICGFDRLGCPIALDAYGQTDLLKLMKAGYKNELMRHRIQIFERNSFLVRRLMAEQQKEFYIPFTSILDMEGLSWRQLVSTDVAQHVMLASKTFESNYPETVRKIMVINAPTVFTILWSIVKPFISERTMEKIEIYGKDREQWQEALFKLASADSLPLRYGGTLPDDTDISPKIHECSPKERGSY